MSGETKGAGFADALLAELQFDEKGLIPAIAQQQDSGEVLMLAWMSAESIRETLSSGYVCYWSRSRGSLWRKGETSGHVQKLIELRYDCDDDAILLLIDQTGPACHTNRRSCFHKTVREGRVEILCAPEETVRSPEDRAGD
jgi:phosphoribosyl-AMP cyclohydrolase